MTNKSVIFKMYYDETNNFRKLRLKSYLQDRSARLNCETALNHDFILGGIAFEKDLEIDPIVKDLFNKLHLQSSIKELKYKYLASRRPSFFEIIESQNVTEFLNWLYDNRIYVHYFAVNCFYFSIVDIIDSLDNIDYYTSVSLKSILYQIVINKTDDFLSLLEKFNYPNLQECTLRAFKRELCEFLKLNSTSIESKQVFLSSCNLNDDEYCYMVKFLVDHITQANDLCFLRGNEDKILIDNFATFYASRVNDFSDNVHVFDEECQICGIVSSLASKEKKINISFIDSRDDRLIQISDVFVGLISAFFYYIDNANLYEVINEKRSMSRSALNNLRTLLDIVCYSEQMNIKFFNNINSLFVLTQRNTKIKILCSQEW